jgi:hypothetical protein
MPQRYTHTSHSASGDGWTLTSTLKYTSPMQFEQQWQASTEAIAG